MVFICPGDGFICPDGDGAKCDAGEGPWLVAMAGEPCMGARM